VRDGLADHWAEILGPGLWEVNEGVEVGGVGERPLAINRVGVEKLLPAKFAKIKSRQDALQTTFSIFPDIFYPPIFDCFEENRLFQHPLAISLIDSGLELLSSSSISGRNSFPASSD
jgi:hypothetical protein